ncbi:MAG: hypothetical protein IJJ82_06375 [Clostridia bacterium]|nr:hypothetical protein [Clostridia bacterium]
MKKTKKIAIIFAIILLIGSVAFASVYYFTDIFKTPQEAFYSYITKATSFNNGSGYQEMLEEIKAAQEKSYKTETSLGVEINSKKLSDVEAQQMLNMMKNLKLNISTNAKASEKKSTSNISLNFGGFSAGDMKVVRDGDKFGVKSQLLGDKFLVVENNNLKQLVEKLGGNATNIPNKIESIDAYDLLYISKEDEEKLEKTYKDIFKNNISSENYTKEENVKQKINGEDVNTTAYKLSLDEKDFINVMTKVLETVEEDDTLLNIITEKINKIIDSDLINNMNVSTSYSLSSTSKTRKTKITEKISKETLKNGVRSLINELKAEGDYASSAKAEIIVYAANNDIAKMEIKTNNEVLLAADFFNKDNRKHIVLYANDTSYSTPNYYTDYYKSPKRTSELVKIMEIEYKNSKIGDDETVYVSFTIFEDDEKVGTFGIDMTSKGKMGQGKCETSGKIFFEVDDASYALVIDSKTEFTDKVEVENLDSSNSNILNNMSEGEIKRYFQGISNDFENTLSMFGLNNSKITNNKFNNKNNYTFDNDEFDEEEFEKQVEELRKQAQDALEEKESEIENQNEKTIEEKVQENKEKINEKQKQEREKLEQQLEELKKSMEQLKESNL